MRNQQLLSGNQANGGESYNKNYQNSPREHFSSELKTGYSNKTMKFRQSRNSQSLNPGKMISYPND